MKIKKIISAILILIFTACSLPVSIDVNASSVQEVQIADIQADSALADALGIDIKPASGEFVTRGEFVYALMQALKCVPSSVPELPFKDVKEDAYYASSLKYALSLKIVSDAESFNPDSPLTWAQASKMMVVALGRDLEATMKGGWPYGYINVAGASKLNDGISASNADDAIKSTELNILIKNFLLSNIYEIESISGDSFSYKGDRTVMEVFFDIFVKEGIVTSNSQTALYDSKSASEPGFVEIDEVTYKYNGQCDVGDFVNIYTREMTSGVSEIVYMDNSSTSCLTFNGDDIISFKDGKLEYYDENNNIKKKSSVAYPAIIYNGKAYPDFNIGSISAHSSHLEAIDNNADGKTDVFRVYEAKAMFVESVDELSEVIVDKNSGFLKLSDEDIVYTVISDGKKADLSAIRPSSVVTYYESADKKLYNFITDSETVTGIVSEYNANKDEYIIGSSAYSCTDYFNEYYAPKLTLGTKVSVVLSANGEMVAVSASKSANAFYGYLIDLTYSKGLSTSLIVKILTENDGVKVFEIKEDALLDGNRKSSIGQIHDTLRAYIDTADQSLENHLGATTPKYTFITATSLIKYSLDSDGKIDMIDTADATGQLTGDEDLSNGLTRYKYPSDVVNTSKHVYSGIYYLRASKLLHPYFKINDNAKVFIININEGIDEDKKYTVTDGTYFTTHTSITTARFIAYDVDAAGLLSTVVIFSGSTGAGSLGDESPAGVVTSVTKAIAPDEEEGLKITVLADGEYSAYYITDPDVLKTMLLDTNQNATAEFVNPDLSFDNPGIIVGDYIRFECDHRNIITIVGKEFDAGQYKLLKTFENHGGSEIDYYYGKIYAKSSGLISIVPSMLDSHEGDLPIEKRSRYTFNVSGLISVFDSKTKEVSISTVDEILSYVNAGNECHSILIKLDKNSVVADMVIYK